MDQRELQSLCKLFCEFVEARLAEEGEHVFLVSLHTRLVERVDAEHIAANTASLLEEIEQSAEMVCVEGFSLHGNLRNAAVDVGQTRAEHSFFVAIFYSLAGKVVQAVEIFAVRRDFNLAGRVLHADYSLEHNPLAFLNILAHRVQVGSIAD